MIIVKLIGGLGNQMFQVAFARALSLETKEEIFLDISVYKKYKIRNFSLSNLRVDKEVQLIDKSKLSNFQKIYLKTTQKTYHIFQKVIGLIPNNYKTLELIYNFLSKFGLHYNFGRTFFNVQYKVKNINCLYGYFQSENYFLKHQEQIRRDFIVNQSVGNREGRLLHQIKNCNAVAISMRLGEDYTNSKLLNVCNEDYYYKAIDYIDKSIKDAVYFIFSDRIDFAKSKFNFKHNVYFIDGFKDYESLRLMYSCKHFIIANSSFSWWGSYLSSNSKKIVVAPSKWYNDDIEKSHIYLDSMILIDV